MADTAAGGKPLSWRLIDGVDRLVTAAWPRGLHGMNGYLFLLPAVALVFILVVGLSYMLEYSLHELDLATYRLKEAYSLTNYQTFFERPVYLRVLWRSLLAAAIVTPDHARSGIPLRLSHGPHSLGCDAQVSARRALPAVLHRPGGARLRLG